MQSREANLNSLRLAASAIKDAFPNVPVFHTLGNHEAHPVNQYRGGEGDSWLLNEAATQWGYYVRSAGAYDSNPVIVMSSRKMLQQMMNVPSCVSTQLPDDAVKTLKSAGFYTARARPGLRVVALNTNMFISSDFWLQEDHFDVEGYVYHPASHPACRQMIR